MKILYHKAFLKHYRQRILLHKNLVKKFKQRRKLFLEESKHPQLKDHRLKGEKKQYRAFSISGDIRVVYKKLNETIRLYDIGTNAQVY